MSFVLCDLWSYVHVIMWRAAGVSVYNPREERSAVLSPTNSSTPKSHRSQQVLKAENENRQIHVHNVENDNLEHVNKEK